MCILKIITSFHSFVGEYYRKFHCGTSKALLKVVPDTNNNKESATIDVWLEPRCLMGSILISSFIVLEVMSLLIRCS